MVSMQIEENSPSPQIPTAQCVGREFVRQYYTLLGEAPRYVYRFYGHESIFVRGNDSESVIGQQAIANRIEELGYENCHTRIRGLDAQETLGKGIVVQVVGEMSVRGENMRRFFQTFVLSPQSEKKYYVHNDILCYEDELFGGKLPQENGTPGGVENDNGVTQPVMINGNVQRSPVDVQNTHYIPASAQIPAIPVAAVSMLPVAGGEHISGPAIAPVVGSADQGGLTPPSVDSQENSNEYRPAATPQTAAISPSAIVTSSAHQQPLPPRSQPPHQTDGQVAPVQTTTAPAQILMPSSQPVNPAESAVIPLTTDMAQRQQSSEKASPVPSEEPSDSSWAGKLRKGLPKGPAHIQTQHHHPQPGQMPGTSGPPMISPTASHPSVQQQQDVVNKQQQNQSMNRHQYRGGGGHQSNQPHGPGAAPAPDSRSSPAPSGGNYQNAGGGGSRQSYVENLPNVQQIYIRSLPNSVSESALAEVLSGLGCPPLEVRIKRKQGQGYNSPYAFAAFNDTETPRKLIELKCVDFHNTKIFFDVKRHANDGNYSHNNQQRPPAQSHPNQGMMGGNANRGPANVSRNNQQLQQRNQNYRPVGDQVMPGGGGYGPGGGAGGGTNRGTRTFNRAGSAPHQQ